MTHWSLHGVRMQDQYHDRENLTYDTESCQDDTASWGEFYNVDWAPKEIFVKFRQHVEGYQLGVNFEAKECNTKLVLKPVDSERKWKLMFEPKQLDVRLLTKKISLGRFLNLQFGVGHEFRTHSTGWSWKITPSFGTSGVSQIQHKTLLPIFPGFDVRVGWNAEYVLPDMHGTLGTGDPVLGMNLGQFYASLERVETIFTNMF